MILKDISLSEDERQTTQIGELDRVLGGGIVPGSLVLVGGDPGIGKSTLLLQVCRNLAEKQVSVLYISGEESLRQIKLRANRIGQFTDKMQLLCETNLEVIREVIERRKPDVVVIDSIQTMFHEDVSSATGKCLSGERIYQYPYADRKGNGGVHFYCRSCDERRKCGRSEGSGTYGGYGALF